MKKYKGIGYWYSSREPRFPHPEDFITHYSEENKSRLLQYLEAADICSYSRGFSECRLGCKHLLGGEEKTDGVFVFPIGLIHYVDIHNVGLPQPFLEKVFNTPPKDPTGPKENIENSQYYTIDFSWWIEQTTAQTNLSPDPTPEDVHPKSLPPDPAGASENVGLELSQMPELQKKLFQFEAVYAELCAIKQDSNWPGDNKRFEKMSALFNVIHHLAQEIDNMKYDINRLKESEKNKTYQLLTAIGELFLQLGFIKTIQDEEEGENSESLVEKLTRVKTFRSIVKHDTLLYQILSSFELKISQKIQSA